MSQTPEGAVVKACMEYLKLRGVYAYRQNTGAAEYQDKMGMWRSGWRNHRGNKPGVGRRFDFRRRLYLKEVSLLIYMLIKYEVSQKQPFDDYPVWLKPAMPHRFGRCVVGGKGNNE